MSDARDQAQEPEHRRSAPIEDDAHQLRAIADAVPALIAYVDAGQRYRFNNHAYAEWFGRTPDELRGTRVRDLLGKEAYEAVRGAIETALSGQPASYEKLVPYERGSRWTSTQFIPDVDPAGEVRGFVALVTDVTERKRAEEEVGKVHEQLLLSDHLASVGTLAMGVAHEVNNPLAVVIANQDYVLTALGKLLAECSAETPASGQRSELSRFKDRVTGQLDAIVEPLRDAREAADRVRRIVRDLEVFSDPGSRRQGPVDVHRVLASSIKMLGSEVRHHGRLVEDYGDVPLVFANEALLGQVFLNLLVNAAQALEHADSSVHEIRVTTRTGRAGHAVVEVRDTGCGIAHEHLGRLFDPFFTTRPVGEGVGLGLWISSRILAGFGASITVESQQGKGSVFTVTLPAYA